MRAVVCDACGPPEVLRVEESTGPRPELTRSWSGSTPQRLPGQTPAFARPSLSAPASTPVCCGPMEIPDELAGEIAAVGSAVTEFALGDEVFGVNAGKLGTNAEFVCMQQTDPLVTNQPA